MRLLLCYDRPARLHLLKHLTQYFETEESSFEYRTIWQIDRYLNKSTVSLIKFCSHVNSFSVELGVFTDKYQRSALQLL
jgi:hypothetical protein